MSKQNVRRQRGNSVRGDEKASSARFVMEVVGDMYVPRPTVTRKNGGTRKAYFCETPQSRLTGWFRQMMFLDKNIRNDAKLYEDKRDALPLITTLWMVFLNIIEESEAGTPHYEIEVTGRSLVRRSEGVIHNENHKYGPCGRSAHPG